MIDRAVFRQAIAIMTPDDRRDTVFTLFVIIIAATATTFMIGAVLPFLRVLSDPTITDKPGHARDLYEFIGFTDKYQFLLFVGLGSVAVIIVTGLIQLAKGYYIGKYASMRVHSIGSRLLENYLRQEYEFFLSRHSGELSKEILNEAGMVVNNFFKPVMELAGSLLTTLFILSLLFVVDTAVTLTVFAALGAVFGLTYFLSRKRVRFYGKRRAKFASAKFRAKKMSS
jgi:ABC-type bacteriocin/lantibiotic exporter with double-glycine peptidase domain